MAEAGADVKEERNLSVIQRLDKDVVRVIGYASHVVVYIFNEEEKVSALNGSEWQVVDLSWLDQRWSGRWRLWDEITFRVTGGFYVVEQ